MATDSIQQTVTSSSNFQHFSLINLLQSSKSTADSMEEEGGLYSPERYQHATLSTNFQQNLRLPPFSQPTSANDSNDTEQSPGRISVATVETWPRFTDYQPTSALRDSPDARAMPTYNSVLTADSPQVNQADRSERTRNGAMNLLAMADIRIRSRYPIQIICPHCSMDVVTMIVPKRGAMVYCGCILMTFIGLCCVPFLLPSMQDIQHFCPHCSQLIGTNTPM